MPIPLLKLPYVVQRELLPHFCFPSRLMLSLCSDRASALVKAMGKFKVKKVHIYSSSGKFVVVVEKLDGCKEELVHFSSYPNLREKLKEMNKRGFCSSVGFYKSMTMPRPTNTFKLQMHSTRRLAFEEADSDEIQKSISNHMMALSHPGTALHIHIMKKEPTEKFKIPNFEGVTQTTVDGDLLPSNFIEQVIKTYPGQQCLSLQTIYGNLKESSEVFNVPDVSIGRAGHITEIFIRNFKGRNLQLDNASFSEQRMIKFLENWKNGSENQDLETLILTTHNRYRFEGEEIIKRFQQNQPTVPKEYHYSTKFSKDITYDCENAVNIKRASDGKVASVIIEPWAFHFLVWNDRKRG